MGYENYYIIEILADNKSIGFVEYDHSSGGYPCISPIYMAHKFFDKWKAKENALRDIKVLRSIRRTDHTVLAYKILECGVIREVFVSMNIK